MPEAMKKAAALAKVKDYVAVNYPTPQTLIEQLMKQVEGNGNNLDEQMRSTLGTFYEPFCIIKSIENQSPVQARSEFVNLNQMVK